MVIEIINNKIKEEIIVIIIFFITLDFQVRGFPFRDCRKNEKVKIFQRNERMKS